MFEHCRVRTRKIFYYRPAGENDVGVRYTPYQHFDRYVLFQKALLIEARSGL